MKIKYILSCVFVLFCVTNALQADNKDAPDDSTSPSEIARCPSPTNESVSGEDNNELCFDETHSPKADDLALFFQGHGTRGPVIKLKTKIIRKPRRKEKLVRTRPIEDAKYCNDPGISHKNQLALAISISFKTGTANLTEQTQTELKKIGEALQNEKLHGKKIMIEGHTDASGACDYNIDLSKKRADAVKAFLITEYKLTNPIEVIGEGEFSLLDPKHPTAAINRRVRIAMEKPANTAFSESLPLARNP
jgi:outer membrane protein OmpA-like peptidoglycan-associated protein